MTSEDHQAETEVVCEREWRLIINTVAAGALCLIGLFGNTASYRVLGRDTEILPVPRFLLWYFKFPRSRAVFLKWCFGTLFQLRRCESASVPVLVPDASSRVPKLRSSTVVSAMTSFQFRTPRLCQFLGSCFGRWRWQTTRSCWSGLPTSLCGTWSSTLVWSGCLPGSVWCGCTPACPPTLSPSSARRPQSG